MWFTQINVLQCHHPVVCTANGMMWRKYRHYQKRILSFGFFEINISLVNNAVSKQTGPYSLNPFLHSKIETI